MGLRFKSVVVVTGLGSLSLACGGLTGDCETIQAGDSCLVPDQRCLLDGRETECGINGYECRDGKWRALMTRCNPPPPPEDELPPPKTP